MNDAFDADKLLDMLDKHEIMSTKIRLLSNQLVEAKRERMEFEDDAIIPMMINRPLSHGKDSIDDLSDEELTAYIGNNEDDTFISRSGKKFILDFPRGSISWTNDAGEFVDDEEVEI